MYAVSVKNVKKCEKNVFNCEKFWVPTVLRVKISYLEVSITTITNSSVFCFFAGLYFAQRGWDPANLEIDSEAWPVWKP